MDEHIKISILCQIYGKLLTEKQMSVLNDYYNEDLSLSEIAQNRNISRQAVRDLIQKGEEKLFEYEKVLKIMENNNKNQKTLQIVFSKLSELENNVSDKKAIKILNEVQKELRHIAKDEWRNCEWLLKGYQKGFKNLQEN